MTYFVIYAVIGAIIVLVTHEELITAANEIGISAPFELLLVELVAVLLWPLFILTTALGLLRGPR